jgi:hypothetical protein
VQSKVLSPSKVPALRERHRKYLDALKKREEALRY